MEWIRQAIENALHVHRHAPLDVYLGEKSEKSMS
jgi:hypothetical protein